jgi:prepilin peptidase CpaA
MPPLSVVWAYVVLAVLVVAAGVTDVRSGKIFNAVTYPAIALGLIGHTLFGGLSPHGLGEPLGLAGAAEGMAAGFLPMLAAWSAGGVGMGDAKLMAAVGALGGWEFALATLMCGLLVALVMAVVMMIWRRIVWRTLGRVWRFLVLALSRHGSPVPTADSPKVPLGLAFSIGAGAALIQLLFTGRVGWPPWE